MPIYREISKTNFDPEAVAFLVEAYECACRILELSGKCTDAFTELVAQKIVQAAREGETDAMVLCTRALNAIGLNQEP